MVSFENSGWTVAFIAGDNISEGSDSITIGASNCGLGTTYTVKDGKIASRIHQR